MVTYDNSGKKIGEITVIIRPDEGTITTNTVFSSTRRVVSQNIATRDNAGNVKSQVIYDGKILP